MTMLERVARALRPEWWDDTYWCDAWQQERHMLDNHPGQHKIYREASLKDARAAIEALMEPTEEMKYAGRPFNNAQGKAYAEATWRAMLKTALEEGK